MGQTAGGFPANVQKRILRATKPLDRPARRKLPPADFASRDEKVAKMLEREPTRPQTCVTYLLYPKVFEEFVAAPTSYYGDTSVLPTPVFFYGMEPGEEIADRHRAGQNADHQVPDDRRSAPRRHAHGLLRTQRPAARRDGRRQIAGNRLDRQSRQGRPEQPEANRRRACPAWSSTVAVQAGDSRQQGQKLLTLEAMKMETTIYAERDGKVAEMP